MLYQCGFEYKLCSLIRDLHYKIILQRRTTKAVFISGYRYQFLQRRARKTRANRTHGAAATHCPAHLVLCPLRRCTAGNALKRRSVNTRREPSPSPARSCGPTHNGRILERGRHGVRRPRLAIRWVGPEIRPQASAPFARAPTAPHRRPAGHRSHGPVVARARSLVRPSPEPAARVRSVETPTPAPGRKAPESARPATITGLNSTRPAPPTAQRMTDLRS